MDCLICRDLVRAFESGRSAYIEARSSVSYGVSNERAAKKSIDMERARWELEEHRLVCASAVKRLAPNG